MHKIHSFNEVKFVQFVKTKFNTVVTTIDCERIIVRNYIIIQYWDCISLYVICIIIKCSLLSIL